MSVKWNALTLITGIASTATSFTSLVIIGIVYKKNRNNEKSNINVVPISGVGEDLSNLQQLQNIQESINKRRSNKPAEKSELPSNEQTQNQIS